MGGNGRAVKPSAQLSEEQDQSEWQIEWQIALARACLGLACAGLCSCSAWSRGPTRDNGTARRSMVRRRSTVRFRKGGSAPQRLNSNRSLGCQLVEGGDYWSDAAVGEPRSWIQGRSVKTQRCVFGDPAVWPLSPASLSVTGPAPGSREEPPKRGEACTTVLIFGTRRCG
jgi:hypothetical protein